MRPWLFRIATNSCLDELRRRQRIRWRPWDSFVSVFHPSQIAPDDPEKEILRSERVSLVRAALEKLSPRDRAALMLREYQGMSVEEVGQTLNISREAAKVTLFRARERLRAAYLQLGGEPPESSQPLLGRQSP
jgi:RNA polymerase sigma-70 factor (ECF subfamily)